MNKADVTKTMFHTHRIRLKAIVTVGAILAVAWPAWAVVTAPEGPASRVPLAFVGVVLAGVGVALGRILRSWHDLTTRTRWERCIGVAVASVGIFLGMYSLTEVPPMPTGSGSVIWWTDHDEAIEAAQRSDRPVVIDFTADWCVACKELEAEVLSHPVVQERLDREFVPLKIDFDRAAEQNNALLERYEVAGLPRIAFVSPQGTYLAGPSFDGKIDREAFNERLDAALAGGDLEQPPGRLEHALAEGSLWSVLLLVFVAGVLSSMTPCVYPLIPITISVFGARQARSKREGFLLSMTYVAGIAVTYALMGIAAATVGSVFGAAMQNAWLLGAIALLFFVLGLSSLGVMEFRLPGLLQTKLSQKGGAGYAGALAMGLVAGIIAAPCTGPIVAGILLYVARQQDILLGSILLVDYAFGMGMIFVLLGTFSSLIGRLPRAGAWMEGVKTVFGIVFIALAIYYVRMAYRPINEWVDTLWSLLAH